MKNLLLIIVYACIGTLPLFGQSSLNGKVLDKSDNKPLANASVILLNQDSILQDFSRANEDGVFHLKNLPNASYIFIISYPKFEMYSKVLELREDTSLGTIVLSSRSNLIEEVVITQKLPIKLRGDTIEYDAGSFETEKNAKLEDLLRRLPGLTVSGDGAITAHGKSVSKVLIDGEEFFGYDPKIAIRNIRADAVDKVQVYERKSREAEMTDVDDGKRFQTVNVILKEEARNGIFGNAEFLAGTDNLYTGDLFVAKFNRTERLGITVNTNNMGDSRGRGGSLRNNNRITGEPKNTDVGANYENRFFKNRLNVNGNYNFNNNSNKNERENYNKEIISPTEVQETNSNSKSENSNQGHNVNTRFRLQIDSSSNLDMDINAKTGQSNSKTVSSSYMTDGLSNPIRDFNNDNESIGNNSSADFRLNYRKRLNRRGRFFNIHFSNSFNESDQESIVKQYTYLYRTDDTTVVNQNRVTTAKGNTISTQMNFSDRITDKLNYSLGYNISNNLSKNKVDAFDNKNNTSTIDLDYSQNQENNNLNQGIIATLNYLGDNYLFNISNRTNHKNQELIDEYRNIDLERTFWDNDLNASFNYRLSSRKNINITYQNNYDVPSFDQLQPLQPQTNPIFRQEGNPNLKKASNNSFSVNYNTLSLLKGTSWNINSNIGIKSNPIINKRTVSDSLTISTYENIMGKSSWNASINSNYSKPIFQKQIQFNFFSNASYNNGFSFIRYTQNNIPNTNSQYELANTQTTTVSTGISFSEQDSKGLDFDFNWRVSANNQRNNIQSDLNYTNLITGGNGYFKFFLPHKTSVTANIVYSLEGPTKFYKESIQQFYTNLAFEKKLFKSQNVTASVKAYDIFNTYNNINRNNSDTNFSESTQMVLTRYLLVGIKWDFNKYLGKSKNE